MTKEYHPRLTVEMFLALPALCELSAQDAAKVIGISKEVFPRYRNAVNKGRSASDIINDELSLKVLKILDLMVVNKRLWKAFDYALCYYINKCRKTEFNNFDPKKITDTQFFKSLNAESADANNLLLVSDFIRENIEVCCWSDNDINFAPRMSIGNLLMVPALLDMSNKAATRFLGVNLELFVHNRKLVREGRPEDSPITAELESTCSKAFDQIIRSSLFWDILDLCLTHILKSPALLSSNADLFHHFKSQKLLKAQSCATFTQSVFETIKGQLEKELFRNKDNRVNLNESSYSIMLKLVEMLNDEQLLSLEEHQAAIFNLIDDSKVLDYIQKYEIRENQLKEFVKTSFYKTYSNSLQNKLLNIAHCLNKQGLTPEFIFTHQAMLKNAFKEINQRSNKED